jgi:hypothetical protein
MAHNLRPGLLDDLGFTGAVEATAEKTRQASGLSVKLYLANVDGLVRIEFGFRDAGSGLAACASGLSMNLSRQSSAFTRFGGDP